jgi:photosystem II stability/assembly factor-like uncharacterized protein
MAHRVFHTALACILVAALSLTTLGRQGGDYTIQAASVPDEALAREATARYRARGYFSYYVKADIPGKGVFYRIRVGWFANRADAQRAARVIGGASGGFVTPYDGPANAPMSRPPAPPPEKPKPKPPAVVPAAPPARTSPPQSSEKAAPRGVSSSNVKPEYAPDKQNLGEKVGAPPPIETRLKMASPEVSESAAAPAPVGADVAAKRAEPAPPDAASAWIRQASPLKTDLRCVHFANARHGWAGGARGVIVHTSDGGETWSEQASGVRNSVNALFFLNERIGWALAGGTLGVEPRESAEEPQVLRTDDGGLTWRRIADLDAQSVWFADPQTGYAAGNYSSVWRTDDGGKSWTRCDALAGVVDRPTDLPDAVLTFTGVQFLDDRRGWATGNFYSREGVRPGGVYFTENGGRAWQKRPLPVPGGKVEIINVQFQDARCGYVVAETYRGDARYVSVYRTTDGGETWSERPTTVPGYHRTRFVSESVGWTVGGALPPDGETPYASAILKTVNGGATWEEEKMLAGTALYDAFFLNERDGWVVGQGGAIFRYNPNFVRAAGAPAAVTEAK